MKTIHQIIREYIDEFSKKNNKYPRIYQIRGVVAEQVNHTITVHFPEIQQNQTRKDLESDIRYCHGDIKGIQNQIEVLKIKKDKALQKLTQLVEKTELIP